MRPGLKTEAEIIVSLLVFTRQSFGAGHVAWSGAKEEGDGESLDVNVMLMRKSCTAILCGKTRSHGGKLW